MVGAKRYTWEEAAAFGIGEVQDLYRSYVNASQVALIGSFGFGRDIAVRAEGIEITTANGRRILDFTGGIGVLNHGHNHPRILAARRKYEEQRRMEVHKNFLSPYIAALSHNIAQLMPDDLRISYFCNSGAEAVEGAVKLAYKYHEGARKTILVSDISFHGKLLGSGGLTQSPELHFKFPTIPNIATFAYNDIASVEEQVRRLRGARGASDVYALVVEPMNGSSLRECSTEFLVALRDLCTREGIVLIFDEVYTGWAKTGALFCFMHHNVVPDIVTSSKSFGGGKASIACYVTREPIFRKAYDNLNDATLHSTTFNGFGEETITAIEAVNIIIEDDYCGRAQRIGERLRDGLRALQRKHPAWIREIRGRGGLNGVIFNPEINALVQAAIARIPGAMFRDERFLAKFVTSAVISELYNEHGILAFYGSNREIPLIVAPSLVASDAHLDAFLRALDATLAVGKVSLLMKFVKQKLVHA